MIRLKRLYSDPEVFKPLDFRMGVNIISGEKVEANRKNPQGKKTNGVGKSICIEFINYCLLKKVKHSRISLIPDDVLSADVKICLDIEINGKNITIIRKKKDNDKPIIVADNQETVYNSLEDATKYLSSLLFQNESKAHPSFRQFMALLVRDERSEFKDILHCHDTTRKIPIDLAPHLYLLGINSEIYENTKITNEKIKDITEYIGKVKIEITQRGNRTVSDARAELNSLLDEIKKMGTSLEELKSSELYEVNQDEIAKIQSEIDKQRVRQESIKLELEKIRSLPRTEYISETDIEILYNQFRHGLGEIISRSLDQVKEFKEKIENFQQGILNGKRKTLEDELNFVSKDVRKLDERLSNILKRLDQTGSFKDLKNSLAIYNQKNEALSKLRYQIQEFDSLEKEKRTNEKQKDDLLDELNQEKEKQASLIDSFLETILEIHEFIMKNKKASFDIKPIRTKDVFAFNLRIHDDGSHSVNRIKVFIYDLALLFNEETRIRHPKLLIHDNIFDVDQDTFAACLNYLARQETYYNDFQYIFTLNRDRIENEEITKQLKLDINRHRIANLTKENKFLYKQDSYQEL